MKGVFDMKNRNKYSRLLQVVREYLNSDMSLSDVTSKNGIPSPYTIHI
jgi:hypothetical protein